MTNGHKHEREDVRTQGRTKKERDTEMKTCEDKQRHEGNNK